MSPYGPYPADGGEHERSRGWPLTGLVFMLLLGAFPALSSLLDLLADSRTGLPSDHAGTFTAVAGAPPSQAPAGPPRTARHTPPLVRPRPPHALTLALLLFL